MSAVERVRPPRNAAGEPARARRTESSGPRPPSPCATAHHSPPSSSGDGVVAASAAQRRSSTATTAATPNAPTSGAAITSRRRARSRCGSRPSAESASPSTWSNPVSAEVGRHDDRRRHRRRPDAFGAPPHCAEDEPERGPGEREPGERLGARLRTLPNRGVRKARARRISRPARAGGRGRPRRGRPRPRRPPPLGSGRRAHRGTAARPPSTGAPPARPPPTR